MFIVPDDQRLSSSARSDRFILTNLTNPALESTGSWVSRLSPSRMNLKLVSARKSIDAFSVHELARLIVVDHCSASRSGRLVG